MAQQSMDWEAMFNALVAYKKAHGDCDVPTNWKEDPQLGRWVSMQRQRVKKAGLLDEQADRLVRLGFVWDPSEKSWNKMFVKLIEYKKKQGDCAVPTDYPQDQALSDWVANQRHRNRKGKLSADRFKKLEEIGFNWSVYKTKAGNAVQVPSEPISQKGNKEVPLSAADLAPVVEAVPFSGGKINIPQEYQDWPIKSCGFSVRLENALTKAGIICLGDLDGNRFETFKPEGYAKTSQLELSNFLGRLISGQFQPKVGYPATSSATSPIVLPGSPLVEIPAEYRNLAIKDLWVDGLIKRKLERLQISTLGDIQGRRYDAIVSGREGESTLRKWVDEINHDLYKVVSMDFEESVVWLLKHIEKVLAEQKPEDVATIEARFGKAGDDPRKLEDVAKQFGVTRERIRQIEDKIITEIVKRAALQGSHAVDVISRSCEQEGFPLTPDKLGELASAMQLNLTRKPRFYALILHLAYSSLPIWIRMPNKKGGGTGQSSAINAALSQILETKLGKSPWRTCYFLCLQQLPALALNDFVRAVIDYDKINIEAVAGGEWHICLRKIDVLSGIRAVLADSNAPLSPHEITRIGKKRFADQWPERDDRGLENKLMNEGDDIFRLESGRWGLVKHIKTPPDLWPVLQGRFAQAVRNAGHAITTIEFLKNEGKGFAGKTNEYELMAILRQDSRFVKTGRMFMVGLKGANPASGEAPKVPRVTEVLLGILNERSAALKPAELKRLAQERHSFSDDSFGPAIMKLKREGLIRQTSTGAYCGK